MNFNNLSITNHCRVHCQSRFYDIYANIESKKLFEFSSGINILRDKMDSDVCAVSYLLSMYTHNPGDFILYDQPQIILNGDFITLENLSQHSCYMDRSHPLFSSNETIRTMVSREIERNGNQCSLEQVRDIFCLDHQRFERPLRGVGHEIFRSMAAIGYAGGKELFCFPWLSMEVYIHYRRNISGLLEILEEIGKMAIVPLELV